MKIFGYLVLLLALLGAARAEDGELKRLQAALDAANTQADLNQKSRDLATYVDGKLGQLEQVIRSDQDEAARTLFNKAAKLWRDYREAQVESEAHVYRGGSIQPLIQNLGYIRITQERLEALRNSDPEGKYKDK